MAAASLAGLRILLVEDQLIVAMDLESMLTDLGCVVVGPVGKLDEAIRHARDAAVDVALLDVNLDGESIGAAASELKRRGIPVILSTGYGASTLPKGLRGLPTLEKPVGAAGLKKALRAVLNMRAAGQRPL